MYQNDDQKFKNEAYGKKMAVLWNIVDFKVLGYFKAKNCFCMDKYHSIYRLMHI